MGIIAIPIYKSRVSPVFDSCTRVLIIDLKDKQEIARREVILENFSLTGRIEVLGKLNVKMIICGGISDVLYKLLKNANIRLITGIAGEVEQVIHAYLRDQLNQECFYMPGYKTE
jgi:predicted Fe-Mo cluster-binding NifX family protein